jgi:hypothetical protein
MNALKHYPTDMVLLHTSDLAAPTAAAEHNTMQKGFNTKSGHNLQQAGQYTNSAETP